MNIHFTDQEYNDDSLTKISDWVRDISQQFETSDYFKQLTSTEQEHSGFLLTVFFEYAYSYGLVGPGHLSPDIIDELMLDVMPRKISTDVEAFEAFAPMMEQFFLWCEEKKIMAKTLTVRSTINARAAEMVSLAQDPEHWGLAKSLFMGGSSSDIDHALDKASAQLLAKPIPIRYKMKVGRNEPCPCGSGKKYKKCCITVGES